MYGAGSLVIFRRYLPGGSGGHTLEEYKDVRPGGSEGWAPGGGEQLRLWPAKGAYELPIEDFAAVHAATADAIPLVSQTEIADASSGLRAIIECRERNGSCGRAWSVGVPSDGRPFLLQLSRR